MSSKQSKLASWQQLAAETPVAVEPQVNTKEELIDEPVIDETPEELNPELPPVVIEQPALDLKKLQKKK